MGTTVTTRRLWTLVGLAAFALIVTPRAAVIQTPAEDCDYSQYTQHEQTARFLGHLAHLSKQVNVQVIGRTREVRNFGAKDLYLCVITEEGADSPKTLNRNKPTFMMMAAQHGGEQSGKEAALWLIRDLAVGELQPLLKKVNFLIIPQPNPHGNWMDRRQNEQDLDINRDHVKLESEETQAVHRVFRAWMPEVTFDVHEKGDDFYRISTGALSNLNTHPSLQQFQRAKVLPEIEASLKKQKVTWQEYLVTQPMGVDSSAGVRYEDEDVRGRETMKRYSTTDLNDGRGSFGIYQTLSFMQEGASRHDIPTLRERTRWQYLGIRALMESIAAHADEALSLVRQRRQELAQQAQTYSDQNLVYLTMEYVRDPGNPTLTMQQFDRAESPYRGILKVDKKAGEPVGGADLAPYPYPEQSKVATVVVKNWFPNVEPRLSVTRPLGYVVPAKYEEVIDTLLKHGVAVYLFTNDNPVDVEAYQVTDIVPAKYDYLPPDKLAVQKKPLQAVVKKGDFWVPTSQPAANAITCFLEPQSDYGFIRYRALKLIPGKGDVFAAYRVVKKQELPVVPYKSWTGGATRH